MKMVLFGVAAIFLLHSSHAQQYRITTDRNDSFSLALVKLLNCAADRFAACKGDSLRSTWLMGDDHKLAFDFPGSSMAIIRIRDWDKNAYVEFRGFNNVKEVAKGMQALIAKIKQALGDQLVPPVIHGDPHTLVQIAGLSLQDKNGYFSSNIELFAGSSSADPYLAGPEKEEDNGHPKKYFILLKIQAGIPSYQYYIPANIVSPDAKLTKTLKQLFEAAANDFDSLPGKRVVAGTIRRKKTDTLQINGYTVLINKRGSNYTASIFFPAPMDSVAFDEQWNWCHRAVQSAVGSSYVYHPFYLSDSRFTTYYSIKYDNKNPAIQMEHQTGPYYPVSPIEIKVRGTRYHPVNRGMDIDDID